MLICMRTTLIIDDALFKAAKRRAAASSATLSDVVNDALRRLVNSPPREKKPLRLPIHGVARKRRRVAPNEIAEALLLDT
jgi:Arc/MetJ family transcription regulator